MLVGTVECSCDVNVVSPEVDYKGSETHCSDDGGVMR